MTDLNKSLLAVFAHPDDEAFLVGGSLTYYASLGYQVYLLCLTWGESGQTDEPICQECPDLARLRQQELQRACEIMGVRLVPTPVFRDGTLSTLEPARLAQPIQQTLTWLRPQVIVTFGPDALTGHPDHLAIHHATRQAFDEAAPAGSALFYASLCDETVAGLSSCLPGRLGDVPLCLTGRSTTNLSVRLDVRAVSPQKWAALACHRSQAANFALLTEADRVLLGQTEHFELAALAGLTNFEAFSATDLFEAVRVAYNRCEMALAS